MKKNKIKLSQAVLICACALGPICDSPSNLPGKDIGIRIVGFSSFIFFCFYFNFYLLFSVSVFLRTLGKILC